MQSVLEIIYTVCSLASQGNGFATARASITFKMPRVICPWVGLRGAANNCMLNLS